VLSSPALAAPALPEIPAPWHSIPDIGPLLKQDRVLGPAQAEISIVVWSDPECPYCKQFSGVPDAAVARANSGGTARANFALRLLPLPFHGAAAVVGALGALCVAEQAGPDGYYKFLGDYFARTGANGRGLPPAAAAPKTTAPKTTADARLSATLPSRMARATRASSKPACAATTPLAASPPRAIRPKPPMSKAPRRSPCATT
jgi:hypothetical protein